MDKRNAEITGLLIEMIEAGRFDETGHGPPPKWPSIAALAKHYSCSTATIQIAILKLENRGFLVRTPTGRIKVISKTKRRTREWSSSGRYMRARKSGLVFGDDHSEQMEKETLSTDWATVDPHFGGLLKVSARTKVLVRCSRTLLDGEAVEHTTMMFPKQLVVDAPDLETGAFINVTALIEGTGREIASTQNWVQVRGATDPEAAALDLAEGVTVLAHTHVTLDVNDQPVEVVENVRLANATILTFTTNESS